MSIQIVDRVHPDLAEAAQRIAERGIALGSPLTLMEETDSTNDVAKRALKNGDPHGATFVAELQRAGRGRHGRAWLAAPGECLLMSVVLRLPCPLSRLPQLSLAVGLAVRDAVAKHTTIAPEVKWPNDVLLDRRKVAGVLVEGIVQGDKVVGIIAGVGLNVHTRVFPDEIAQLATSVAAHAATPPDRAVLLADVLAAIDRDVTLVAGRGLGLIHARLAQYDALRGSEVSSDDGSGVAEGIDLDGRLVVRLDDGRRALWIAGEVRLAKS